MPDGKMVGLQPAQYRASPGKKGRVKGYLTVTVDPVIRDALTILARDGHGANRSDLVERMLRESIRELCGMEPEDYISAKGKELAAYQLAQREASGKQVRGDAKS